MRCFVEKKTTRVGWGNWDVRVAQHTLFVAVRHGPSSLDEDLAPCGDETSVAAVCSPRTVASKSVVTVGVHMLVAATSVAHRGVGQDSEAKPPSQRA